MPQRGRECQWRQPGSPMSSLETITQRWRSGAAIICSSRPRLASSISALAAELGAGLAKAQRERVADPFELADAEQAGPAGGADTPLDPVRGRRSRRARPARARGGRSDGEDPRGRGVGRRRVGASGIRTRRLRRRHLGPLEHFGQGTHPKPRVPRIGLGQSRGGILVSSPNHRAGRRCASHSASSIAIVGHALAPIATSIVRCVFGLTPRPAAVAPKSSDSGRSLVGDHQRSRRELARPALERLAGLGRANPGPARRPGRRRRPAARPPTRRSRSSARRRAGCG